MEAKKRAEEEEAERERVSYAQIDWHGFVVVETVDYQPWEVGNFPPPTNPVDVGARVLMQRRVDANPRAAQAQKDESNTNVEDMDEDSSEEETDSEEDEDGKNADQVESAPEVHQPPALPTPGNVEVRKYDPKAAKAAKKVDPASNEYLVSPITGERIPAAKVQEHMRIGLLDPRWVEERDKQITAKASEEQVFAPGQAIESNLKHLAERRTDIFGVGEDAAQEAAIGKKMGEEEVRKDEKVTWDGHSSTAESASRAARANISINEQIEQIHRNKGFLAEKDKIGPSVISNPPQPPVQMTAPPVAAPPVVAPPVAPPTIRAPPAPPVVAMVPRPPIAPPVMMAPNPQPFFMGGPPQGFPPMGAAPDMGGPPQEIMLPDADEPANKRPRGEDYLIPERDFLAHNQGPVHFRVLCPIVNDKPEWNLTGQSIAMSIALTDTISVIKAKIHEETGMAPGKQKLQMDALFLKDPNTLAYYNFRPGTAISLQIKERGGRKK